MDKITRIRQEIEKLTDELTLQAKDNARQTIDDATDYCFGVVDMQMNLLSFIDSLEEEPQGLDEAEQGFVDTEAVVNKYGDWGDGTARLHLGVNASKYLEGLEGEAVIVKIRKK